MPTDAFKVARLSVVDPERATRTFLTSGTTLGARGAHHFGTLALYDAAIEPMFKRAMLPDRDVIDTLVLAPTSQAMPESSLSYMLDRITTRHGSSRSRFACQVGPGGTLSLDLELAAEALDEAVTRQAPLMILATAFALMQLFDASPSRRWRLPRGSRLMETGGFKGRSREVSRRHLYALFTDRLGLPESHCVSEYSMTELSSQAYTPWLRQALAGRESELNAPRYEVPPWVKLQVVDPVSLLPLDRPDEIGLVRWIDLANVESALAIQTSDRGRVDELGRLELLGRAPESELRGCSLTIEELLEGQLP